MRFTITDLVENQRYVDTSYLPGARMIFAHSADTAEQRCLLNVKVSIAGPLAIVWSVILGRAFKKSVPADLARLVRLVESARV